VVGLLKYLGVAKADFFGESYGGAIATMIALHHPELVGRVATYGTTFGPPQVAHNPEMLRFDHPPTPDSSRIQFRRENYKKVAPDPDSLLSGETRAVSVQVLSSQCDRCVLD
jgi:pimeloyl-ACP methyl ester carboxylesterase